MYFASGLNNDLEQLYKIYHTPSPVMCDKISYAQKNCDFQQNCYCGTCLVMDLLKTNSWLIKTFLLHVSLHYTNFRIHFRKS